MAMHSPTTRLNRAKNDLERAEDRLARILQYQPSAYTSRDEIRDMRSKAEDRVYRLRARVAIRERTLTFHESA